MSRKFKHLLALFAALQAFLPSIALAQDKSILAVSPFMMPPRSTWATIDQSLDPNVVVTEAPAGNTMGFRTIHLRKSSQGRKQAAIDLAKSGLVKTGDILLSFRPLWDRTLAYAHMQLGVSHAGLAFVVTDANGPFVMTLESPISYSSPLNSPEHYGDLDAFHVIRPSLNASQVRNLEKWARAVSGKQQQFEFYADYSLPMYKRGTTGVSTPRDQVQLLANILLGQENRTFASYCSEFVWSMLALRDCDPAAFDSACIKMPFGTANGMMAGLIPQLTGDSGLAQGPEASLTGAQVAQADRTSTLTQQVFIDVLTDESQLAGRMSSGHIAVAKASRDAMKAIQGYYMAGEPPPVASAINKGVIDNVSPTSFLVRSNAGLDDFRYVGTVIFDR
jgi:hypothetical protein